MPVVHKDALLEGAPAPRTSARLNSIFDTVVPVQSRELCPHGSIETDQYTCGLGYRVHVSFSHAARVPLGGIEMREWLRKPPLFAVQRRRPRRTRHQHAHTQDQPHQHQLCPVSDVTGDRGQGAPATRPFARIQILRFFSSRTPSLQVLHLQESTSTE